MYTKDKTNRITLRLNDEQFEFVKGNADILGVSPSDFLRMVINSTMAISKAAVEGGLAALEEKKEGTRRENEQADKHDIV